MAQQNIHYELTKQRISQSMGARGALVSYELLDRFLHTHADDVTYKQTSLQYFVWVDEKGAIESANKLEKRLFADFGTQSKRSRGFGILKSKRHYEELFTWELDGDIKQHLGYVDGLGTLPNLKPRPPLYIVIHAEFWLKGAEKTEDMKSHAIAWLSPSSNTASFLLNFPHSLIDDDFVHYRKELQANCPVELDDRFFYIKKAKDSGGYSFRKAF